MLGLEMMNYQEQVAVKLLTIGSGNSNVAVLYWIGKTWILCSLTL